MRGNEEKSRGEGGNDKTGKGKEVSEREREHELPKRLYRAEIASSEPKTKNYNIQNTSRNGTSLSAQMTVSDGMMLLSLVWSLGS